MARRKSILDIIIGSKTTGATGAINKVNNSLRGMLKFTGLLSGAVGFGGVAALGIATIKAAGDFESLKLRLEAVTGSAKRAGKIVGEVFDLFIRSPLLLEPLLKARILFEGIGVRGKKAMTQVAEASAALGKNILEVAGAVASLETEPLRRMGIELRRTGEQGSITFRDRLNRPIKVVGKSTEELRKQLLSIFGTKFGGFLERAARTFQGLASTLKGSLKAALAEVGDSFLPGIKKRLQGINQFLIDSLSRGDFTKLGDKLFNIMNNAWNKSVTVFKEEGFIGLGKAAAKQIGGLFVVLGKEIALGLTKLLFPLLMDIKEITSLVKEAFGKVPKGTTENLMLAQEVHRRAIQSAKPGMFISDYIASLIDPTMNVSRTKPMRQFAFGTTTGTIQGRPGTQSSITGFRGSRSIMPSMSSPNSFENIRFSKGGMVVTMAADSTVAKAAERAATAVERRNQEYNALLNWLKANNKPFTFIPITAQ